MLHMREDRVNKIIAIARPMFEENGVKHTTISAIMDEAGITRELFYYYFSNKRELINAVIDDYAFDVASNAKAWSDDLDAGKAKFNDLMAYMRRPIRGDERRQKAMLAVLDETGLQNEMSSMVVDHAIDLLKATSFYALCQRCAPVSADKAIRFAFDGALMMLHQNVLVSDEEIATLARATLRLPADL